MGLAGAAVLADLAFFAGDVDLARASVERSVQISEPLTAMSRITAHGRLGRQLLLDGRPDRAIEALEHALSLCGEGKRMEEPGLRQTLAEAWLAAGDATRAREIADELLARCLETGVRLVAVEAALTLSRALRAETGVAAAPRVDELLATADRLIAETRARNLTSFVLVERAALAALRGDVRAQEDCLRRALEGFTRMGATGRARATAATLTELARA